MVLSITDSSLSAPISPARYSDKQLELWKIFSWQKCLFLLVLEFQPFHSLLGKFQLLGICCFDSLMAKEGPECLVNFHSCQHVYTATVATATNPLPRLQSSVLPGQPVLLMPRTKSGQEKTGLGKPFIVPNVATPGGSAGGCLSADSNTELSSLLLKPEGSVARVFTPNYRRFTCSWRSVCISHSTILRAHEVVYLQKLRSWATRGSALPPLPWWKWWRSYLCWPKRLIQDAWNSHVSNVVSSGYPQSFQSNQVSMREDPPTSCLAIVPQFKSAGTAVREWPISCQSFQPWTV